MKLICNQGAVTRFIDQDIGVVSTKTHLHHDLKISSTFAIILSNVGDHYLNTMEWTYPFVTINVHIRITIPSNNLLLPYTYNPFF